MYGNGSIDWIPFLCTVLVILFCLDVVLAVSTKPSCDRGNSRDAANVISDVIKPQIVAYDFKIPKNCPLDVGRGLYSIQEAHKVLMRKNVWRCSWDQKVTCTPFL